MIYIIFFIKEQEFLILFKKINYKQPTTNKTKS